MKIIYQNLICILLILFSFTSCVENDDFDAPDFTQTPPEIEGNVVSLSTLEGVFAGNDEEPVIFSDTNNYVEAYVISSDEAGNFFKELILQDKPENPTFGVRLLLDVNPLFTKFEVGRKVYIKLEGLTFGIFNGVFTLGMSQSGTRAEAIPQGFLEDYVVRDTLVADIIPVQKQVSELRFTDINTFIELTDVQFSQTYFAGNSVATYASDLGDEFDGERTLESCKSPFELVFSTSTFADFKGLPLPSGSGSIKGILTKDFLGEFSTFSINSPEDVDMVGNRCDPLVFSCGLASDPTENEFLRVDFEDQNNNSPISIPGWTNYTEAGTEPWQAFVDNSANQSLGISARVGAFNSGDESTISWLISPEIPVQTNSKITLEFKTSNSFADNSIMQVLYSANWDGTEEGIATANWGIIQDAYIVENDQNFTDWVSSGIVDMSCFEGSGHIAFKYTGSDEESLNGDRDGTYELDEIVIHIE